MNQVVRSREHYELAARGGDVTRAVQHLRRLWESEPSSANAGFIVRAFESVFAGAQDGEQNLAELVPLTPLRVFFLATYTIDPMLPLLRAAAYTSGLRLEVGVGGYNTVSQLALNGSSELYAFGPQLVFVVQQTRDVAPELVERFSALTEADKQAFERQASDHVIAALEAIRRQSTTAIVVHALEVPAYPANGLLDAYAQDGQALAIRRINGVIAARARELGGVYMLDSDAVIARRGADHLLDERRFASVKLPFAATELISWVREWMRFVHPISGRLAKVVVSDLDNTLWGGVVGEDGFDGIQLGADHRGVPFLALQQALLDMKQRGVLLAICSKNNQAEALEVFERHPGMRLRLADIAAFRINWQDKAQNLRELARELNLGLDAFVFLDDNPVEREWVREQLPEVTVLELPDSPFGFATALRCCPLLERLSLSTEDRQRSNMYAAERSRAALQSSTASLPDFLHSLAQTADVARGDRASLARMAQLTQKTNQFNLTTRRYGEAELAELLQSSRHLVLSIAVRDRFGDHGLVGVAIVQLAEQSAELDTFLLSCRVLSRGVETAFLAAVSEQLKARGVTRLRAHFVPTKKNAPAAGFLSQHAARMLSETSARTTYELDLNDAPSWPAWISRTARQLVPSWGHDTSV
jgi:FkbH-like protein